MANERLPAVLENAIVAVGDTAPDFELPALIAGVRKSLRLSQYRGQKSVVLVFYPSNWQETSARQLRGYQEQRALLLASQTETVAIAVDSIMNTAAWEREIGPFDFPLCADFWPHGVVCARYGVLRQSGPAAGGCERAVFVVNRSGRVAFKKVYEGEELPPLEDVLFVLEKG